VKDWSGSNASFAPFLCVLPLVYPLRRTRSLSCFPTPDEVLGLPDPRLSSLSGLEECPSSLFCLPFYYADDSLEIPFLLKYAFSKLCSMDFVTLLAEFFAFSILYSCRLGPFFFLSSIETTDHRSANAGIRPIGPPSLSGTYGFLFFFF